MRTQSHCVWHAWNSNASHWARPIWIRCDTLSSMNKMANLYDKQGQHVKAESIMLVDCLSKREVVVGVDHPDTIRARNNLDKVCSRK